MVKSFSYIVVIITLFSYYEAFASSAALPSPVRTNTNLVTSEFETYIPDKRGLDLQTEEGRKVGARSAEIPNIADLLSAEDAGKLLSEQGRLSSIDENALESEGRRERNKEENAYFSEFETDYTKPGAIAHKRDADEIVADTETGMGEISRFMDHLRASGIDCRGVAKTAEIRDPYIIDIERKEVIETDYDQVFCEHLMNIYQCTETLSVVCDGRTWAPMVDNFVSSWLAKAYSAATGELTLGWNENRTLYGGMGRVFDYDISFSVVSKADIQEFTLKEIGYDDFIRVTVNDIQVFIGSVKGSKLELVGWRDDFHGVKVDDSGEIHSAEQRTWFALSPNIDIRPHLKNGANNIHIRLIVGDWGGVYLKFIAKLYGCSSFRETWGEGQCTHRR